MIKAIFNQVVACPFTSVKIQKWLDQLSQEEPKIKGEVEISVIGESLMKKINHKYRGKDKVTDVLSFAWRDPLPASPLKGGVKSPPFKEGLGEVSSHTARPHPALPLKGEEQNKPLLLRRGRGGGLAAFFGGRKYLGEIYICYPQIKRQAKEYGISEEQEFKRMLVHGLLHLVGYDHIKKQDAAKMFKQQEKLIG